MDFTTTTSIGRLWKKAFDKWIKVVLANNEDVWYIIGKDYYDAIKDTGLIEQLKEEMREANDPETVELIHKYDKGDFSDAISLDEFRKEYDV